jgi:hypothetical protein
MGRDLLKSDVLLWRKRSLALECRFQSRRQLLPILKNVHDGLDYDDSGVGIVKICAIDAHSSISSCTFLRSQSTFYVRSSFTIDSRISLVGRGN